MRTRAFFLLLFLRINSFNIFILGIEPQLHIRAIDEDSSEAEPLFGRSISMNAFSRQKSSEKCPHDCPVPRCKIDRNYQFELLHGRESGEILDERMVSLASLFACLWWTVVTARIRQWKTKSYLNQTFPTAFPFCPSCQNFSIPKIAHSMRMFFDRIFFFFRRLSATSFRFQCRSACRFPPLPLLTTFGGSVCMYAVYTGVASNFDCMTRRCHLYIKKFVHTAANSHRRFCRTKWQRNANAWRRPSTTVVVVDRKPQYGPSPSTAFIRRTSGSVERASERAKGEGEQKWINEEGKYNRKSFFILKILLLLSFENIFSGNKNNNKCKCFSFLFISSFVVSSHFDVHELLYDKRMGGWRRRRRSSSTNTTVGSPAQQSTYRAFAIRSPRSFLLSNCPSGSLVTQE